MAISSLVIYFRKRHVQGLDLPWSWLSAFGFLQAIYKVMAMVLPFVENVRLWTLGSVVFAALSFLCLFEFYRRFLRRTGARRRSWGIYLFFGVWLFCLLFGVVDRSQALVWTFYLLGVPSLCATAYVFFCLARQPVSGRFIRRSRVMAWLFISYAVFGGLIVPPHVLQRLRSLHFLVAGLPVELWRGLLVTAMALLLMHWAMKISFEISGVQKGSRYVRVLFFSLLMFYIVFLGIGYHLVVTSDDHERTHVNQTVIANARLLADAIGEVGFENLAAAGDISMYPRYRKVHERMRQIAALAPFTRDAYLVGFQNGELKVLVGSQAQVFQQSISLAFVHVQGASAAIRDVFYSKNPLVLGPYQDSAGREVVSVFVPLLTSDNLVSRLLGMDLNANRLLVQIARVRFYMMALIMAFLVLLVVGYAFLVVFSLKSFELEVQKENLDKTLVHLRETEAELARSEETFRGILNNSPNAIFGFDRDLRLIFWNQGAQMLYGHKKEDIIDEKDPLKSRDVVSLLGLRDVVSDVRAVFDGKTFMREMMQTTLHGKIAAAMTAFPVKDPQGRILFGMGLVQDVSSHKLFEDKLAASHAQLQSVLDGATQVMVISTDPQGVVDVYNSGAEQILGFAASQVVGRPIMDFISLSTVDAEVFNQKASAALGRPLEGYEAAWELVKERGVIEDVWNIKNRIGEDLKIEVTMTGRRDEKGQICGIIGIGIDRSEHQRAADALQKSNELLGAIMNSISVRIFWKDRDSKFLGCNAVFARDAGLQKPEDLIGKYDADMVWKEQAELYRADDRSVIESGQEKLFFEEVQTTPTGEKVNLLTSKVPLRDSSGAIVGVLGTYLDITKRKQAEEALRLSQQKYQDLVNNLSVGVYRNTPGPDGRFVEVNPALVEIMEADSVEQLLNTPVKNLYRFPEKRREFSEKLMRQTFVRNEEIELVTLKGKHFYASVTATLKIDEKGENTYYGVLQDISEQKRMEQVLSEERDRLRTIATHIGAGLCLLDHEYKILWVNEVVEGWYGESQKYIGRLCYEAFHPRSTPWPDSPSHEAFETGTIHNAEEQLIFPDGTTKNVIVVSSPIRGADGKVTRVLELLLDVTDRKNLEIELKRYSQSLEALIKERTQALQTSELMFRRLFESSQDAILIIEAESGSIIDVNPQTLLTFECTREQVLGLSFRSVPFFDANRILEKAQDELQNKISVYYDDILLHSAAGHEINVELRASFYYVEGRKIIQCNIRDITERKKLDKIKTEFVSMVSHELRTPLSAIKEGVEIVSDGTQGKLNRDQRECLGIALSNIHRLNRLIGDILDISKIQSNLLTVTLAPCDVNEIIDQVYSLVKIEIEKRGMFLVTDIDRHVGRVMADRDRLIQVLMNLLNNAVKFTREKSRITLKVDRRDGRAEFSVRDEGPGIPPDELSRLFGRFVQLDSTLVRRVGGTGLGLYISKNLVEAMNGRIWAESKQGEGSVFRFELPLAPS